LDALVKNIEQNNRNLLNANKNLQGAFDELRANAKNEINKIKDKIQDNVDQANQLNNLLQEKDTENKSLFNKKDKLNELVNEKNAKNEELLEKIESVMQQINIKSSNVAIIIADTNKINSENMLKDKNNKIRDLDLKNTEIKNNKIVNHNDQMKTALKQCKHNAEKLNLDIDLINRNLQNVYSTSSAIKIEIDSHTIKCNELESANNILSSIIRIITLTDLDLTHDLES